ncbi:alpha/beta fold hydrolase [Nakamurella leprariae]|uniref:Alpha/beta fold hydrolase n=1 Tax=Nakamurella leprariae TaxID=2803911 RepID=A0A938YFW2_9ACTN|nr:alpha/beta fold hydrolase [Nakamurella leprariae]MBM9467073.1 alpha/beta fold hydrolase [Nakamurella leprariae]
MTSARPRRTPGARAALTVLSTLAVLSVLSVLAGCTAGPSDRPALATWGAPTGGTGGSGTAAPGTGVVPAPTVRWQECPERVPEIDPGTGLTFRVDCAQVPVERSSLGGSSIVARMQLTRARTAELPEDAVPLIVLPDEPGRPAGDQVATVAAGLTEDVRGRYAVVVPDLVGTGRSDGVDCVADESVDTLSTLAADPTSGAGATRLDRLARDLTFDCSEIVGGTLSLVDSAAAAGDLETVRVALGLPELTLLGRGFGATLAGLVIDRTPDRVTAAVLDAPFDPSVGPTGRAADRARAAEAAFDDFAAACTTGPDCPLGPDPRGRITELVAGLEETGGVRGSVGSVTGGTVLLTLLLSLGEPAGWPELAAAVGALADAVSAGTPTRAPAGVVRSLLQDRLGGDAAATLMTGRLLYACNDTADRLPAAQLAPAAQQMRAEAPLFGAFSVGLVALCSTWPAAERALTGFSVAGAAPILVLAAADDPVAPAVGVQAVARQLPSSVLVTWRSAQHGSYPVSGCVSAAVDAYLTDGHLPPDRTVCPP